MKRRNTKKDAYKKARKMKKFALERPNDDEQVRVEKLLRDLRRHNVARA